MTMHAQNPRHAWWFELSPQERERLDNAARGSLLELPRFPFWDERLVAEVLSWTLLDQELTSTYVDWLAKLHRRALSSGREWNRAEFLRQSRLHEVGE